MDPSFSATFYEALCLSMRINYKNSNQEDKKFILDLFDYLPNKTLVEVLGCGKNQKAKAIKRGKKHIYKSIILKLGKM